MRTVIGDGTATIASRLAALCLLSITAWVLGGCASTPSEDRLSREELAAAIERVVLPVGVSAAELPKPKRCLSDHQYRNFQAVGDQYLLFSNRRGGGWINKLRTRCFDLRHSSVLIVHTHGLPNRMCDGDRFAASDWFRWPWYRQWPWRWWGYDWWTNAHCVLGSFRPLDEQQYAAIDELRKTNR